MLKTRLIAATLLAWCLASTAWAQDCSDKNWKACKGKP